MLIDPNTVSSKLIESNVGLVMSLIGSVYLVLYVVRHSARPHFYRQLVSYNYISLFYSPTDEAAHHSFQFPVLKLSRSPKPDRGLQQLNLTSSWDTPQLKKLPGEESLNGVPTHDPSHGHGFSRFIPKIEAFILLTSTIDSFFG